MHILTDWGAVVVASPNTWEGNSGYFKSVLTITRLLGWMTYPYHELVVVIRSFGKNPYQLVPPNAIYTFTAVIFWATLCL